MKNYIKEIIGGIISIIAIDRTGYIAVIGICVVICTWIIAKLLEE